MHRIRLLTLFLFLSGLLLGLIGWVTPDVTASALPAKQLAAPPADFATVALPDPAATGIRSRTAMLPVTLTEGKDGLWRWQGELPVDDGSQVTLMLFAEPGESWTMGVATAAFNIELQGDQGVSADLYHERTALSAADDGTGGYPADLYRWENAPAGTWTITVSAEKAAPRNPGTPSGYLVAGFSSPYQLYTHLESHSLLVGTPVTLHTFAHDSRPGHGEGRPAPMAGAIRSATLELHTPSGAVLTLPMREGKEQFSATFVPDAAGVYITRTIVEGVTPEGNRFVRTSEHTFPVLAPTLALQGDTVIGRFVSTDRLSLSVTASVLDRVNGPVQISGELWGRNSKGEAIPVVWLGGLSEVQQRQRGSATLTLGLDSRWVSLAGAQAPFELRNVRVQDVDTAIPVSQSDRIEVRLPRLPQHNLATLQTIPDEMLMGERPDQNIPANNITNTRRLLLVHGYCSGRVWPLNQFASYSEFQDLNQNRSHDQFANLIRNHGSQFSSFGIVAHSQGGAASLHLYTYYWSGLDYSSGNRLIQSVGTPYQGTSLAGNLALLGQIFGAGCGTNHNLTYDGASLWLSGIPSWARNRTFYHTTSFATAWWRYDYCHLATDLFLSDPEDGTVERWAGQLSGGVNLGHKTGWCHTTGMRDPAQYLDSARNSNMNLNANR